MDRGRSFFKRYFVTLAVFLLFLIESHGWYTTKVETRFGKIQGLWSRSTRGRLVAQYLGIPYAEPPVGNLRFRSPQPWNRTWDGIFEATKNTPMCMQLSKLNNPIGSEDCLHLNIYVPLAPEKPEENYKLPVMVFIHGGKYSKGGADSRKMPPNYMMDQDVILVTVNFRLNILGFLSTASKASPGNYGLKDIVMALRWIQENIEAFNGDRNSVTLWGHSSGAGSVHTLAMTNKTEGLFHRYILQSGYAFSPWNLNSRSWVRNLALTTAKLLDCLPKENNQEKEESSGKKKVLKERSTEEQGKEEKKTVTTTEKAEVTTEVEENSMQEEEEYDEEQEEDIMQCLRNVDVKKLVSVMQHYFIWRDEPCCIFVPTIEEESDDAIVTMLPQTVLKNRLFRDIPFIMGAVKDEGLLKSIPILTNKTLEEQLKENFDTYMPYILDTYHMVSNMTEFSEAIKEYFFSGNVSTNLRHNLTQVISDSLFFWPMYQTLMYQTSIMKSNVYVYFFTYEGTFSTTLKYDISTHYGVAHIDDLNYLIPLINVAQKDLLLHNTESDTTIINIMTEMWSSFAIKGVPAAWRTPTWPDFKKSHEILRFGYGKIPEVGVEDVDIPERMTFWEQLTKNLTVNSFEVEFLITPKKIEEEETNGSSGSKEVSKILVYLPILFVIYLL